MNPSSKPLLDYAELALEASAMTEAALAADFDETRFRAHLLVLKATEQGCDALATAVADLIRGLGPVGSAPSPGYGAGLLRVSHELGLLTFDDA